MEVFLSRVTAVRTTPVPGPYLCRTVVVLDCRYPDLLVTGIHQFDGMISATYWDFRQTWWNRPGAAALIGLIALGMWLTVGWLQLIPFLGFFVGLLVYALSVGAMFGIASEITDARSVSIRIGVDTIRSRWFSLLVAFLIVAGLGVGIASLLLIPFFILGLPESNGIGLPTLIFALLTASVAVPYAAYTQFLYPVIINDDVGAIEAIHVSAGTVNNATRAVFAFTATKLVLAYVPFLFGIRGAVQLGRDTLSKSVTYYIDLGADPSSSPTLFEIVLDIADSSTIAAMAILFFAGAVVREFVRIGSTTAFYRRISAVDQSDRPA